MLIGIKTPSPYTSTGKKPTLREVQRLNIRFPTPQFIALAGGRNRCNSSENGSAKYKKTKSRKKKELIDLDAGKGDPDRATVPIECFRAQNPSSLPPANLNPNYNTTQSIPGGRPRLLGNGTRAKLCMGPGWMQ
jgi:hypothetical protein